jgi:hypothetical protein
VTCHESNAVKLQMSVFSSVGVDNEELATVVRFENVKIEVLKYLLKPNLNSAVYHPFSEVIKVR